MEGWGWCWIGSGAQAHCDVEYERKYSLTFLNGHFILVPAYNDHSEFPTTFTCTWLVHLYTCTSPSDHMNSSATKHWLPYNGYFLRLEIFAIWAPKRSILIFAFLIFAIPFNRKKWLIDNYFHTWIWFSSAVIKYFFKKGLILSSLLLFTT